MRKQSFILPMISIMAVLVLVGGGCGKSEPSGSAEAEFSKIGDAIASGQKVVCHITISDESESMETTYWIKGDDMRGEVDFGDMTQTFIQNGDQIYTSASMFGSNECDWFVSVEEEYEENDYEYSEDMEDFDYTQYEDNTMYNVDCNRENFSNDLLKADGEICNMDDMFGAMMEGLDFDM